MLQKFAIKAVLLLLFSSRFLLAAQRPSYTLSLLDSKNGLSSSSVNSLFQDSDSLLWIATWDGLNMYNGSSFRVYNYKESDAEKSIGNNLIQQIAEDGKKNIWVATIEGISRITKKTGGIRNYFYPKERLRHVTEDQFFLALDEKRDIYCFARSIGFFKYDEKKDELKRCRIAVNESDVQRIFFDDEGRLWIMDRMGNLSFSISKQGDFLTNTIVAAKVNNLFSVNGHLFFLDNNQTLFEITGYRYKMRSKISKPVKAIEYYDDHYFLACEDRGLIVLDKNFKQSAYFNEHLNAFTNLHISSIIKGSGGILWCGTDGNGIIKVSPSQQFFKVNTFNQANYSKKQVRAFCEVNNELWIGTKGNGILSIPYDAHSNKYNIVHARAIKGINNNAVYSIFKGIDNIVYIGTDGIGLTLYDPQTRGFVQWNEIEGADKYHFESVYAILQDTDSSIWLGTSGYGLIHLQLKKTDMRKWAIANYKVYVFDGGSAGPANDIIYSLVFGSDHNIWIGCRYGGLSLFEWKTRSFKHFKAFGYPGSLSHNDVLSLHLDRDSNLWVGTSYGLNKTYEPTASHSDKPHFVSFTTENEMPNNTVHAITSDTEGNIWCSTNSGIVKISSKQQETIMSFREEDGLQSNEFSDGSVWQNDEGYVFFGGINGFNYFRPDEIKVPNVNFNLLVSELTVGGKQVMEDGLEIIPHISNEGNLSLYNTKRENNFFHLRFQPLTYLNPEKVVINYLLEGLDKEWKTAGSEGRISYGNLPPGNYKLNIKWSPGDGTWTPGSTVFALRVKPYPALSTFALITYILVLLTGCYIYYRYRKSRLAIKNQLILEHALRSKDQELHQEKLDFFTNVAHELQTPLTLITGSLERYQHRRDVKTAPEKEKKYFLSLIQQQAAKLTYLVQQLLEFRRAEHGHLQVFTHNIDVSQLLGNIVELFIPYAEAKKLAIKTEIQPGINFITDKDKWEKIIYNLLSNAIKHTKTGAGEIVIKLNLENDRKLVICIENPGHIPEDRFEKIFDKFYVVEEADGLRKSSGIGLSFTRELVKLLKGKITVEGTGKTIRFKVNLPPLEESGDAGMLNTFPSPEIPSYLLRSATEIDPNEKQRSASENNARSLLSNLEEDERKSILIVEDDSSLRFLLRDTLEDLYTVYEAENGKEAVEILKRVLPDIIISDIMMPDMDGIQLCNKVKETPETCHIPFILLTAKTDAEEKTYGYEAGADAYITKPFNTPHLHVRIKRLLAYRETLKSFLKNYTETGSEDLNTGIEPEDRAFLQNLIDIINEHLDEELLNPELIEKKMSLSKKQLYRKTKMLTGMTPTEFIRHSRLQKAAYYLRSTQHTVSEIFYMTGFSNQSYFFREFKKEFYRSPKEYRDTNKI